MEEVAAGGISAIGLDWKALVFQAINFIVLLWLLKRFAYRPVLNLLEARRQKIAESLRTADDIAAQKENLEVQRTHRLRQVEAEAAAVISASKAEAASILQAAAERARVEAEHIRKQAAAHVENQRRALRAEVKNESLALIKKAIERLLRQKLDAPADAKFIQQALTEIS